RFGAIAAPYLQQAGLLARVPGESREQLPPSSTSGTSSLTAYSTRARSRRILPVLGWPCSPRSSTERRGTWQSARAQNRRSVSRRPGAKQSMPLRQVDRGDSRSVCSRINQSSQSATDHRTRKRWIRGRAPAGLEAIRCAVEPGVIIVRELEAGGTDVRLELCDAAP